MDGLGAGKLCVLSHKDIGLIVQGPQADDQALVRKFHGAGIIAVGGAPLSHGMIRLFSLGVPTIIVSSEQLMGLSDGMALILDGAAGLISDPSQATLAATRIEPVTPQPGASEDSGRRAAQTHGQHIWQFRRRQRGCVRGRGNRSGAIGISTANGRSFAGCGLFRVCIRGSL
jgi:phosphoenolpyruvate-protein kinase (PTS system EI component)